MAKAPKTEAALIEIRALRTLDVDGIRIPEGEVAEIRAELADALVACGAAELAARSAPSPAA